MIDQRHLLTKQPIKYKKYLYKFLTELPKYLVFNGYITYIMHINF